MCHQILQLNANNPFGIGEDIVLWDFIVFARYNGQMTGKCLPYEVGTQEILSS